MLYDRTGKPKMATIKLEVLISQLVDNMGTRFQRLNQCFWGPASNENTKKHCE